MKSAVLIRLLRILMLAEAVFSVSKTQANVLSVMMFLQYCTLIEQADVVIFVTPIYYYAIHSSLKALLERFTSRRTDFMKMPKKMGLIAVCGGKFEWSFDSINAHFDSLSRYLGWKDIGRSEARGYPTKTDIQKTEYPKLAYQFGFNLS